MARRPYQPDDYWTVRAFLREVSLRNDRRDLSWSLLRWDYWYWHVHANIHLFNLPRSVFLWEAGPTFAAVLNPDAPGEVFLQVHPDRAGPALEAEMLETAEQCLAAELADGRRQLTVWVPAAYADRQRLVASRGYARHGGAEHMRRRPLDANERFPALPLPAGYAVRALGAETELPARSWVSWKAFHPDAPDEDYEGWTWYRNVQRGPLYRRDLDLVAVAPDATLAAFCTVWLDDVTRTAVFEPVGTHPAHRRRGLGQALMLEGLRRAQTLGATLATVSSYSPAAHALYASVGFTDCDLNEPWQRTW